jgi:hypothetical protein
LAWIAISVAVTVALVAGHRAPLAAADANCSDFPNQAAAQSYYIAHGGPAQDPDRLDADHDGIACESLPCPCNTSTAPAPAPTAPPAPTVTGIPPEPTATPIPTATPTPPASLGGSVNLATVTRTSGCHLKGPLPDRLCTPGARFSKVTKTDVCTPGYSSRVRNVSQSLKNAVYAEYGITKHFNGQTGEVDHLVSLELGGSNAESNLFPEAASPHPGSKDKDRLENKLHSLVCTGQIALATAQRAIARDWVKAYRTYIGPVPAA